MRCRDVRKGVGRCGDVRKAVGRCGDGRRGVGEKRGPFLFLPLNTVICLKYTNPSISFPSLPSLSLFIPFPSFLFSHPSFPFHSNPFCSSPLPFLSLPFPSCPFYSSPSPSISFSSLPFLSLLFLSFPRVFQAVLLLCYARLKTCSLACPRIASGLSGSREEVEPERAGERALE